MDVDKVLRDVDLPMVPVVATHPWNPSFFINQAMGQSLIPGTNHLREGVVVKPMVERIDPTVGRVIFKIVNPDYLENKRGKK